MVKRFRKEVYTFKSHWTLRESFYTGVIIFITSMIASNCGVYFQKTISPLKYNLGKTIFQRMVSNFSLSNNRIYQNGKKNRFKKQRRFKQMPSDDIISSIVCIFHIQFSFSTFIHISFLYLFLRTRKLRIFYGY